jgi:hypothetical protein
MKSEDQGRIYWCVSCGGKYHFETEEQVKRHCKREGNLFPVKGIDYKYFSDREEDEGKEACTNHIRS